MHKFAFLIAAGALFALPLPASAAGPMTDVSSQVSIEAGAASVSTWGRGIAVGDPSEPTTADAKRAL